MDDVATTGSGCTGTAAGGGGVDAGGRGIDAGGGGKQIADRLREQGYYVKIIGFGEGADARQAYKNRRAEMYGKLREFLSPDREEGIFSLPPDSGQLQSELSVLPLQYDSEGRLFLPPKEHRTGGSHQGPSLRQLLGRSPDRADSLALAVWALATVDHSRLLPDDDIVCENCDEFTPEEVAALPEEMRELYEMEDEAGFYAFEMPAAVKADHLRLIPASEQSLVGGDLYASNEDFEHKRRIRSNVQQHNITGSEIKPSPIIDLPRQKYLYWWFKPDRKLDSPPHADIAFPVYEILFLGNDAGPFQLAWGNFETSSLNNDLAGLLSEEQKQASVELVQLRKVENSGGIARLSAPEKLPWLKWLLWLAMLAAVAATAKMALSLVRDMKSD